MSLAVWMGGVAAEILELVRSPDGPFDGPGRNKYSALTRYLRYEPQVDIISGTSAGGLNGVLLGYAMANGVPTLERLRTIWLEKGDFGSLLRDPEDADPQSLLRGDEEFLTSIEGGLGDLVADDAPRIDPVDWRIRLFVTSTLLEGEHRRLPDDFGESLVDTDHQLLFEFSNRKPPAGDEGTHTLDGSKPKNRQRLARAARSSASFPGAFEPSLVEMGEGATLDMSNVVRSGDRPAVNAWMIDGGVLMNRPIGPAIDAIFNQQTERRAARRVLAYIHPDPGSVSERTPADPSAPPALSTVISRALVTIPRQESISKEIERLRDHNQSVQTQRAAKDGLALTFTSADLVTTARNLVPVYRTARCTRSVARTMETIYQAATVLAAASGDDRWVPPADELRRSLMKARLQVLPDQDEDTPEEERFFPPGALATAPTADGRYWQYGIRTGQRIAGTVIDLIRRFSESLQLQPGQSPGATGLAAGDRYLVRLDDLRSRAHDHLATIHATRQTDTRHWSRCTETLAASAPTDLDRWALTSYQAWGELSDTGDSTGELLGRVGTAARDAAGVLLDLRALIGDLQTEAGESYFTEQALGQDGEPVVVTVVKRLTADASQDDVLKRLLALEVIQLVGGQEEVLPQEIELVQISALAKQHLIDGGPADPAEKLAGVELGHFGAFLKRSWRANDWMWGRLDAASRLVSVLIEPKRLRQLYGTNADLLLTHLRDVATASDDPGAAAWLERRWDGDETDIRDELGVMLGGGSTLARTRAAVARCLQLEVIRYELPNVYRAIKLDERDKSHVVDSDVFRAEFENAVRSPFQSPCVLKSEAESLVAGAFGTYNVGSERVADEAVSDRGVQTAVKAAVVGIGAAGSEAPLKSVTPPVRGALLWVHRLYHYLTPDSGLARTMRFLVFAVAGALIALTFISGDVNPLVSAVGIAVLAVAFLLGLVPRPTLLAWSLGLVGVAFIVWNAEKLAELPAWGLWIAIGAAALFVLAAMKWRWALVPVAGRLVLALVLVALPLLAVRFIEPVRDWVVTEPIAAAATAESSEAAATQPDPQGFDAVLDWIGDHRIETTAILLIVGFSVIGAYRSAAPRRG